MPKFYLSFLLVLVVCQFSTAQIRCATDEFDKIRRSQNSKLETKEEFEKWMQSKLKKSNTSNFRTEEAQATFVIPVVVHIIHNGEPIGTGKNISDAQVLSQIKVLNNDFQRLNADASQTPAEFLPVAGSMSIEFVLAKQDPLGNATSGIIRVNGGRQSWNLYEDYELKSKSNWPTEQYFNIWVTSFEEYLGYTQFPVSNLQGITSSPNDRVTDGIIIHYKAFGSIDDGPFDLDNNYDKGRTLTHEAGHFLGLRHIWGDESSCAATDYVSDTPPQLGSTLDCPTHPQKECSNQSKMFQNFLDYTDDPCMNIFTKKQVERMEVVLQSSPRRASLLTSNGANPPGNFALDLGILSVETPAVLECSGTHTPTITIRNFGSSTITQANIELKINGTIVQTKTFSLNLGSLSQTSVTFNDYSSSPRESKTFQFKILNVNGGADENAVNNTLTINTITASNATTPYSENFESGLANWNVVNPDGLVGWTTAFLTNPTNRAIVIKNHDYEIEGALDKIISPSFDVSGVAGLLLSFNVAYAQYPGNNGDALSVYVFEDCSDDLSKATRIFFEEGSALATTNSTSAYFTPSAEDWKTYSIPLNDFLGNPNLRIGFVSRNGYGNNIYIDEVKLMAEAVVNLSITKVAEPSFAVCSSVIKPKLEIKNNGTETFSTLTIAAILNGAALPNQVVAQNLSPGESSVIEMNTIQLTSGANTIAIEVIAGGTPDAFPEDNSVVLPIAFIQNSAIVPSRENFDGDSKWSMVSTGNEGWEIKRTNYQGFAFSAAFMAYDNTQLGTESWLVSPKLDFSKAIEASLFADFSYAQRIPANEFISVKASTNCGNTFEHVFYAADASNLTDIISSMPWNPGASEDWIRKSFNLNTLAGHENVLVAIQAINNNGNNLYLDNIEFFENDDSTPTAVSAPFRVYTASGTTYLTFNLEELQPARVQVANIMGGLLADVTQENTLNQTLTFKMGANPALYIFKIQIGDKLYAVRQYMGN
jgi:archaellum component FlaF (FlaF/FlaG flagellin family)